MAIFRYLNVNLRRFRADNEAIAREVKECRRWILPPKADPRLHPNEIEVYMAQAALPRASLLQGMSLYTIARSSFTAS
jgi:hypothetical protein